MLYAEITYCDNNSCNNFTLSKIFASAYVSDAIEIDRFMMHHSWVIKNHFCNNCTLNKVMPFAYVSDAIDIHRIMIHYSWSI